MYSCAFVAILSGCGRYSDFTLPPPEPDGLRPPFRWEAMPDPVLSGGVDSLNPSVIRFHGAYLNLYSEYDGHTWHTALATSNDGVHWEKARTRSVARRLGRPLHRRERIGRRAG